MASTVRYPLRDASGSIDDLNRGAVGVYVNRRGG
jgi:hypothetical protein